MRGLLIAGLVTLIASPVLAAPKSGGGKEDLQRFCSGDAATYCGGMDAGSKEMDACFKQHMRDLSDGCRNAIKDYEKKGRK